MFAIGGNISPFSLLNTRPFQAVMLAVSKLAYSKELNFQLLLYLTLEKKKTKDKNKRQSLGTNHQICEWTL